jgi:glutaredoxin
MKFIRWFVGKILLTLNACCRPKAVTRDAPDQARVDDMTQHMRLYQFEACPFCIKVRRAMARMGLTITTHDVNRSPEHEAELIQGGGKRKVPCLRISRPEEAEQWVYQSSDIITYLEQAVGTTA